MFIIYYTSKFLIIFYIFTVKFFYYFYKFFN